MRECAALVLLLAVLPVAGCVAGLGGSRVRPEAVRFEHPDEIVQGEGFMVLADRRQFAVTAFLNATGYDEEVKGRPMHPVRVQVRELMTGNLAGHPEKVKAWRKYRRGLVRKYMQIYNYEDYALSLSTDYPFRRIRPDQELGYSYTAWILKDFPRVLNQFWETARLGEIWEQVKPEYLAELRKYNFEKMQRQMDFLWSYLRIPRQDAFTVVNVPNLLDCHYHAIGARYEDFYYTVESPGSHSYDLNIHEYLHSIVNRLVQAHFQAQEVKLLAYYRAGKNGPLCKPYQHPVGFAWECLVRALDHRLTMLQTDDPAEKKRIEGQVDWETDQGLVLARPFYQMLAEFEQGNQPFDQFLPMLFERLPEPK
ncbi:MAG: hypothetical protein MUC88_22930 [Planctomycetes bacterium]|nr:hypothetical protein [Planctomycetota bacterium]